MERLGSVSVESAFTLRLQNAANKIRYINRDVQPGTGCYQKSMYDALCVKVQEGSFTDAEFLKNRTRERTVPKQTNKQTWGKCVVSRH